MTTILTQGGDAFETIGKPVNLAPWSEHPHIKITHNDFVGAKAYAFIADAVRPPEERFVGAIVMALSQVNAAIRALPELLPADSILLFRMQFLTAFHADNALKACLPEFGNLLPALSEKDSSVLRSRELRNACAHYGLGRAASAAVHEAEPFGAVVETLTGATRVEAVSITRRWLGAVSAAMTSRISKSSLAHVRALFGHHT